MYTYKYESPIGTLYISSDNHHLLGVSLINNDRFENYKNEIIKQTVAQLEEYFAQKRVRFELPLKFEDDFSGQVLASLYAVKYGDIYTYKELSVASKHPKAYRAVGSVCSKNPYLIVVPCHRIIRSDRLLGGYAIGLHVKEYLLKLEGHIIEKGKIR